MRKQDHGSRHEWKRKHRNNKYSTQKILVCKWMRKIGLDSFQDFSLKLTPSVVLYGT